MFMKRIFFLAFCSVLIMGCSNQSGKSNDSNQSNESSILVGSEITKEKALIFAQKFVEQNMGGPCEFKSEGVQIEEVTAVKNRYKVLQMFSFAKDGISEDYVYKTYVQFFEGNSNIIESWDYGTLTIENAKTGHQDTYRGNMKKRDIEMNTGGTLIVNDVELEILKQNPPVYINLLYKGNLTREQIADILEELTSEYDYDNYNLFESPDTYKEVYTCGKLAFGGVHDIKKGKLYNSVEDFRKGKGIDF